MGAQFLSLFFEAIFLFGFGCVSNDNEWYTALCVLICFSIFVQMAEGTSYGIVPFKIHAGYVMFWALLSPAYYWPHLGGMFSGPRAQELPSPDKEYAEKPVSAVQPGAESQA